MKSSFRWYGDSDPVTLDKIRQIPGMRSIVSAVYDVKPGEVWPEESIKHLVDECAANGLQEAFQYGIFPSNLSAVLD